MLQVQCQDHWKGNKEATGGRRGKEGRGQRGRAKVGAGEEAKEEGKGRKVGKENKGEGGNKREGGKQR